MDNPNSTVDREESTGPAGLPPRPAGPFDRVLCGIDGSDEAIVAAQQARRIAPDASVTLVYAINVADAVHRRDYPAWLHAMRDAGNGLLRMASDRLDDAPGSTTRVTIEEGDVPEALAFAARSIAHPLLAIGSGDDADRRSRSSGPPLAGARLSLRVVEAVPCSVLVARHPVGGGSFPQSITVGVDGSAASMCAYGVANRIASYTGAALNVVVALGGKGVDLQALEGIEPPITVSAITKDRPVRALVRAAAQSDLVVVGNRGLHGLRALGSVSVRVVTNAPASVLVVRDLSAGDEGAIGNASADM